jgi:hypothetical protein
VVTVLTTVLALTLNVAMKPGSLLGGSSARADGYQPTNPCAAPNQISSNAAQTAWQLWVAATCPVNQSQYPYVVWENWIEQNQMYPADPSQGLTVPNSGVVAVGASHLLHGSPLTLAKNPSLTSSCRDCSGGPIRIATKRPLRPLVSPTW